MGGETAALEQIGYGNMRKPWLKKITLWTCSQAGLLTALSEQQAKQVRLQGLKRDEIRTIPHGSDCQAFSECLRKKLEAPYRILHVGNITPVKDQKTLLQAFARIRGDIDCRLRIVGKNHMGGALKELASTLQISEDLEFLGEISYFQLREQYCWAHLLLHSSLHEAQGMVIAEAMACGTVVCGTKVGLLAELGEETALSVECGDSRALAEKTLDILRNAEKYNALRENGLRWAAAHGLCWTAQQYSEIYESL
jgi:glycosyltransferase involved in cell wall biosynthesis